MAVQRVVYHEYIRSAEWRWRRDELIDERGGACERCGSRKQLQVHHLTYERLGHELDSDLIVLCDVCHGHEHDEPDDRENVDLIAGFNGLFHELLDKFTLRPSARRKRRWVYGDCDFCGCDLRLSFGTNGYVMECVREGCGFCRLPEHWELEAARNDCA